MTILVTGGAGFIGSNFIIDWIEHSKEEIVNLDKLTYAGNLENLSSVKNSNQYLLIHERLLTLLPKVTLIVQLIALKHSFKQI